MKSQINVDYYQWHIVTSMQSNCGESGNKATRQAMGNSMMSKTQFLGEEENWGLNVLLIVVL